MNEKCMGMNIYILSLDQYQLHLGLCICVCVCSKDSILELINNHLKLSVTLCNIIYVMQRLDALRP